MRKISSVLLLVLTVLSCTYATETTTKTSTESMMLVQMETGYVIDDVLAFLKSFQTDNQNQISELNEAVRAETEYVNGVVNSLTTQKNEREVQCAAVDYELSTISEKSKQVNDFIEWINKKITKNKEKIEEYNQKSCSQTLEFVEYIRNAHNSLNFIAFLRKALENYSFVQMRAVTQILSSYDLQHNSLTQTETLQTMLIQLKAAVQGVDPSAYRADESLQNKVSGRTAEEIGTKHIDNDKDNLNLEKYQGGKSYGLEATKNELIALLDKLQESISKALNDRIQNQIQLSETTADFITFLEHENEELQKELVVQTKNQTDLVSAYQILSKASSDCHADVEVLVHKIEERQSEHTKYVTQKQQERESLEDQNVQLQGIVSLYEEKIATAGAALKQRYDDVLDNQRVDYTGSVDDRELTAQYNNLQDTNDFANKIQQQVVQTAVDEADEA